MRLVAMKRLDRVRGHVWDRVNARVWRRVTARVWWLL